jgi:hypothetical protein
MLLALASAVIFGSESLGTHDHILLSQFRGFPFRRPLWLAGLRWRYSTPPPHGRISWLNSSQSQSHIATDGQPSVSLGVQPHLGLLARYWLLFDSYSLVYVGRPLWREDGSVFCTCCWPLPAQSISVQSPLRLVTIFYCLRFEISLFVASYHSQGYGGGVRPRLHTT